MRKYVCDDSEESVIHWEFTQKFKLPYISIREKGKYFVELFYDITDIVGGEKLHKISRKVRKIYKCYIEFSNIEYPLISSYFDVSEDYFFTLKIKKEDTKYFTEKLFDYLVQQLQE